MAERYGAEVDRLEKPWGDIFAPEEIEALAKRQTPVGNWYLDLTMVQKYWGNERTYHHTAPIAARKKKPGFSHAAGAEPGFLLLPPHCRCGAYH